MRLELVAQLWLDGYNTYEIAKVWGVREYVVYNALPAIKALARERLAS